MSTTPLNVPIPGIRELQENAARLLQQSLAQAAQTANPAALAVAELELARSNVKALAFVQAVGLHGAYRYLRDFVARQAIPIKSAGQFLDGWLDTYGMKRKDPGAAAGPLAGTGVNGAILPTGTLIQVSDGRQYRVTADVAVAAGVVTPNVIALEAGSKGNLAAGGVLQLVTPLAGVDAAFTATTGLSGGVEPETDSEAIYRLQQRLSNEPLGGAPADYARWALQVVGITRAWGVRNPSGPTSAGVIIMADGNVAPGLPTIAQRDQVRDYIRDPDRGPPDELFVIIPTPVVNDFTIQLVPDTAALRAATADAIKDLFFREAVPGGSIPHSHVVEVVSAAVGEYNHTITVPAIVSGGVFAVAAYNELLVPGAFTFLP
jgi:uncharacterized phage protein gp47/JayE